jgi:thymidylate kinase
MRSAELIDAATSDRVLVFGSLPPDGRDLDLLVRAPERREIEVALTRSNFHHRGIQWVSFEAGSTDAVDLVPADDWGLSEDALQDLFDAAVPLPGYEHLVRPAPHHALLIMARRVARAGGELDPKKRDRVRNALEEDKDGWAHAQEAADGWSSRRAVVALERLYKTGVPSTRRVRAAALAERSTGSGARIRAWRIVLKRKRGRGLVTFSGLDGSGKTSQAEAVRDALERTVGETVIVWTRLSYNPSLKAVARPVKKLLGARNTSATGSHAEPTATATDPGKELRRKSSVVTQTWATLVAIANATSQRRVTRYHLKRGRNVVCDRYTLDSRVHLRYRYGEARRFRFQAKIIEAISPKPLRSYHVEVPPEVAYERKAEQYDLAQLQTQARLYEEEGEALGVTRLDGTRSKEELSRAVTEDVWKGLG